MIGVKTGPLFWFKEHRVSLAPAAGVAFYHGVVGDLDAIATFIRQWLTVNERWNSPKAIAGESYGGQRVAALSRILAEQYAINLNRAILISPALNATHTTARRPATTPRLKSRT